ncbi:class I glutamine amidotransferase-like protein [Aspergillus pseudoustus]|uniref:D-lactate dehydratase n=1 Tax=Aspergillus pseudoustus TaxID=1810923 RepID=A0ABR4K6B5_9EURO
MAKRILHVVTNTAHYDDPTHPTSLLLSELTHAWHVFKEHAFQQTIISPNRALSPIKPRAIYFTGGLGVIYDFPDNKDLQRITREIFKQGGVVSSVCHGYCGLLNTRLLDGLYLVARRNITGFTWREEVLARVNKLVPYNTKEKLKKRGASYKKAKLPFVSYTVVDGDLVTRRNPGSSKETARKIVAVLGQS